MSAFLKNWLVKVFGGRCLSVRRSPIPPPLLQTARKNNQVLLHTSKGGGGEGEPEKRLVGQLFTKSVENTNITDCISSL